MTTVIGQHEVADFATWKKAYDGDAAQRTGAGVKEIAVLQSVENPNDVTFIFEIENPAIMEQMMADPKMQETMKNAGVISKPVMKIFKKA